MKEIKISNLNIPANCHGQRLDQALAVLLPEYSRSQLSQWIKAGLITVNSKVAKPKDKVFSGDSLDIDVLLEPDINDFSLASAEEIPLEIIYEDEDLLVINKPAGLVVHPGAGNRQHTLVNALLHHCPTLSLVPRAGIIHRLDKDTTGLLIIAKTLSAHTLLVRQMSSREIKRSYLCLVHGEIYGSGHIETAFGRHPRNRVKMAVTRQGKEAITDYKVEKNYQGFTLLKVQLQTGRTHQIRVHMSHIGHSVIGDPLYGQAISGHKLIPEDILSVIKQWQRQALHAYQLAFNHPFKDEHLTFTANMPDDFQHLLMILDEHEDSLS